MYRREEFPYQYLTMLLFCVVRHICEYIWNIQLQLYFLSPLVFIHVSTVWLQSYFGTQQEVVICGREGWGRVVVWLEENWLAWLYPFGPDGAQGLPAGLSNLNTPLPQPCFGQYLCLEQKTDSRLDVWWVTVWSLECANV